MVNKMKTPRQKIDKAVRKWFPFPKKNTFCLNQYEFEHRWAGVLSDLPYDEELLVDVRKELESRWVRVIDDEPKASVANIGHPARFPSDVKRKETLMKKSEVKTTETRINELDSATAGSYEMFREKKPVKLRWKSV